MGEVRDIPKNGTVYILTVQAGISGWPPDPPNGPPQSLTDFCGAPNNAGGHCHLAGFIFVPQAQQQTFRSS